MRKETKGLKDRKRRNLVIAICILLFGTLIFAALSYSLDYPHSDANTISCSSCHVARGPFPSYPEPSDIDDTVYNNLCWSCHNDVRAPYEKTHSSISIDNSYGDWSVECRACHEPHHQDQTKTYGSESYVFSAPSTAVTTTTITKTGAGWADDQWAGMLVLGNIASFPQIYYKIGSNTSDTLTVEGTIDISHVQPGDTFAIVYGKFINAVVGTRGVKLFRSSGANSFADSDTTIDGICQVCHTMTKYHRNDGTGDPHNAGTTCTKCHTHAEGFKASCGACHGDPPVDSSTLVHTPPEGTGSITAGAHDVHVNAMNIGCFSCHANSVGSGTTHNNHNITIGFSVFNGAYQGGSYDGQTAAHYDSTGSAFVSNDDTKICSNVYCHGGTMAPNGGSATAKWDDPNTVQCGTCHGATASDPPTRGSHTKHTGSQAGGLHLVCTVCHTGPASNHINGITEWSFDTSTYNWLSGAQYAGLASGSITPVPSTSYGSCTGLYCHSNAQTSPPGGAVTYAIPQWGNATSGQCGTCHKGDGINGDSTLMDSGSHTKHAGLYNMTCYLNCHNNAGHDTPKHADNHVDVEFSAGGSYSGTGTPGDAYGMCSTVYCHSNAVAAPVYQSPIWGNAATGQCGTCHGVLDATPPASSAHTKHVGTLANYKFSCSKCHDSVVAPASDSTILPAIKNISLHADTLKEVQFDAYNPGAAYSAGSCANLYCHSDGTSVSTGIIPAKTLGWNSSATCISCHGFPPLYSNDDPKKNSHPAHSGFSCDKCHAGTTADGSSISNTANHVNKAYNIQAGSGVSFTYTYSSSGGTCSGVSCHSSAYQNATWGDTACLECHSVSVGSRTAAGAQFSANSHHIQGTVSNDKCYQCHWEANSDGTVNHNYHGGSAQPGSPVDLVIYGAGSRPTSTPYTSGTTGIAYTANGSRTEIQKINSHCIGCHSDQSNSAQPFSDGKTPNQYAWDGYSVGAKYTSTATTTWGKYTAVANAAPKNLSKAYSAHGNAAANQEGWNTATGVDGAVSDFTGAVNVACFDCHNSHGSSVSGPTTSYSSATSSGGILKDTLAGNGGYSITYKPAAGGSSANKNAYNPGAGLCFDCHMNADSGATPWGYSGTFGATQRILGYKDTEYFGPGTFGQQSRFPYKGSAGGNKGGHFGASSGLASPPDSSHQVNGLCTPCHDPHGVSPTLGSNMQYAVPLLKGTFLTSPYKEDAAPAVNATEMRPVWGSDYPTGWSNPYHIDQNTFGSDIRGTVSGISETDTQFAGLCLRCHQKNQLTDGSAGGSWKSVDRIHESVKGWGNNVKHKYSCSKCHVPHNSNLPRLMATNCLNQRHKGRTGYNASPVTNGSYSQCDLGLDSGSGFGGGCYSGNGRMPGGYVTGWPIDHSVTCHENQTGSPTDQSWNVKTQWTSSTSPSLTSPTATSVTGTTATLGANITSNGGSAITARGTVWGTTANPTGNALAEGGSTTGVYSHARTGLIAGTKIYYRGYATSSYGTGYSPDGSFYTEPATQASGVNFTSVGTFGMTVNWARGSGDGVIVMMKQGALVDSNPVDGTYSVYTANSAFGSGTQIGAGNYVIYKGTGTNVTVTGLNANTTYYVALYEYKGTVDTSGVNQGTNYKSSPATASQTTATPGSGSYSFTFDYTGTVQTLSIPAGATNIQFSVKGAGGGGGRLDNVGNQTNGQNGHLVNATYATSGVTLSIYVGRGGAEGSTSESGSPGGWGYHSGGAGGDGEWGGYCDYSGYDDWAYGGSGGGGSSAILLGGTTLAEAAGGAGGRSSDWNGECYYTVGGTGGAGGGADYPGTTSSTGGGTGGSGGGPPSPGGNGQVVITYDY